jgi:hypothetical protein
MDFDGAFSRFTTTMFGIFMRARVISERYAQPEHCERPA